MTAPVPAGPPTPANLDADATVQVGATGPGPSPADPPENDELREAVACPKCKAKPGEPCTTGGYLPVGDLSGDIRPEGPHRQRRAAPVPADPPTGGAHYFTFSRDFDGPNRVCGECRRTYDDGEHIEITRLKPYTKYVCPTGGGYGHGSIWTGAYIHSLRGLRDHLCICGAEYVEEDAETWQLSWEMQNPPGARWHTVTVIRSRHAAETQRDGLLELIEQGELIRNVQLRELVPR